MCEKYIVAKGSTIVPRPSAIADIRPVPGASRSPTARTSRKSRIAGTTPARVQGPDGTVACVADLGNPLEQEPRGKGVEREARGLGSVVVASIPAHVAGLLAVRVDLCRPVRERADEREVRRGVPACRLLGPGICECERERRCEHRGATEPPRPGTCARRRHAATRGAPSEGGRGSWRADRPFAGSGTRREP